MEKKFAVGQKWKTRNNQIVTITDIEHTDEIYPVKGRPEDKETPEWWNLKGQYYRKKESPLDLIEQILDFDPSKPVQTRSGLKARILATDLNQGKYTIVAAITEDNQEFVYNFLSDGRLSKTFPSYLDLINILEEITIWLVIYPTFTIEIFPSEAEAKAKAETQPGSEIIKVTRTNSKVEAKCLVN